MRRIINLNIQTIHFSTLQSLTTIIWAAWATQIRWQLLHPSATKWSWLSALRLILWARTTFSHGYRPGQLTRYAKLKATSSKVETSHRQAQQLVLQTVTPITWCYRRLAQPHRIIRTSLQELAPTHWTFSPRDLETVTAVRRCSSPERQWSDKLILKPY